MKTIIYILLLVSHYSLFAQSISSEVITSGGDNYKNNYASMQVTIGEPATETISQNGISLTQGFQQTDIIVTPLSNKNLLPISITVFPNPAENLIKLAFSDEVTPNSKYELYDNTGKLLAQSILLNQISEIPLYNFVSGTYILKVFSSNNDLNMSFTILKK